jgi:hypothetical protein
MYLGPPVHGYILYGVSDGVGCDCDTCAVLTGENPGDVILANQFPAFPANALAPDANPVACCKTCALENPGEAVEAVGAAVLLPCPLVGCLNIPITTHRHQRIFPEAFTIPAPK